MAFIDSHCLLTVRLAIDEYACLDPPDPLFIRVSRLSYLGSISNRISDHFSDFAKRPLHSESSSILIQTARSSLAVPWHLPIGVVVDICNALTPDDFVEAEDACRIDLCVRFDGHYDNGTLTSSDISSLLVNQLKAALVIRGHGLGNFNILEKSSVENLQSIADCLDVSDFLATFAVIFSNEKNSVCAVKLHMVNNCGQFFSVLFQVSSSTTVEEVLLKSELGLSCKVVTHGVELLHSTPIGFLQTQCPYADGFVHLVYSKF